jgi:flagella basal body P-ring formation protein FlgA
LSSAGRELRRGVVTARIRIDGTMLVVARTLPKGSLVGPSDVREQPCDVTAIPAGAPEGADALIGLRTVRALAEGVPWRTDLVEQPPLVLRGQRVALRLVAGGLRLDARGKAKQDGRPGEMVRVLNEDSRREIVGRVAPDGAVDVEL